jgi:hypothetical protein
VGIRIENYVKEVTVDYLKVLSKHLLGKIRKITHILN